MMYYLIPNAPAQPNKTIKIGITAIMQGWSKDDSVSCQLCAHHLGDISKFVFFCQDQGELVHPIHHMVLERQRLGIKVQSCPVL